MFKTNTNLLSCKDFTDFLFEKYNNQENEHEILFSVDYNSLCDCFELCAKALVTEIKSNTIQLKITHEEKELIKEHSKESAALFKAGCDAAEKIVGRMRIAFKTGNIDPFGTIKDARFKIVLQKMKKTSLRNNAEGA